MKRFIILTTAMLSISGSVLIAQNTNWFPLNRHLKTEWAESLNPKSLYDQHPMPGLSREVWSNLNGLWQFDIQGKEEDAPEKYEKSILVPFSPESDISGVGIPIQADQKIWYKRQFHVPEGWSGKFVLLHIGGSDWETTVFINGQRVGQHRGGYDPITLDITYFLKEKGQQEIVISVWDPTEHYYQPRGKQTTNPHGIWYTSVSGIWQSVWMEPVGTSYVNSIATTCDIKNSQVQFEVECNHAQPNDHVRIAIKENDNPRFIGDFALDDRKILKIIEPKLWSPDNPFIYDFSIELIRDGEVIDRIDSYFGMREISIEKDSKGHKRFFLNNQPIFLLGVLDQGWWPDGLYTAPSVEALESDLLMIKKMGFNTVRKHVKVEPTIWYYLCDKLGLLVWQDMPNGDKHADWKGPSGNDNVEIEREFSSQSQYKLEFEAIIKTLYNHPSVIYWTPFNEGWGQFNTVEITNWVTELDSTRIIGGPSGGNFFPVGDTRDHHQYPGPGISQDDSERVLVLGEFGGLGYPVKGHTWDKKSWSYQQFQSTKALEKAYEELISKFPPLMKKGLSAAIYTQITDVQSEVNGIMTFDRRITKMNVRKLKRIHKDLYKTYSSYFVK